MPVYDYDCPRCGVFTALRPMRDHDQSLGCPGCGTAADRVLITAPAFSSMNGARRQAFAVNERAAHEPKQSSKHGAGCGCCAPGRLQVKSETAKTARGAKYFPMARPWMISH